MSKIGSVDGSKLLTEFKEPLVDESVEVPAPSGFLGRFTQEVQGPTTKLVSDVVTSIGNAVVGPFPKFEAPKPSSLPPASERAARFVAPPAPMPSVEPVILASDDVKTILQKLLDAKYVQAGANFDAPSFNDLRSVNWRDGIAWYTLKNGDKVVVLASENWNLYNIIHGFYIAFNNPYLTPDIHRRELGMSFNPTTGEWKQDFGPA